VRRPREYTHGNPRLKALLDRAINLEAEKQALQHRTGGCGEVLATYVFLHAFPDRDPAGISVITWGIPPKMEDGEIMPPCDDGPSSFGCQEFLEANGITEIKPQNQLQDDPLAAQALDMQVMRHLGS
jgi:hypothetical protein